MMLDTAIEVHNLTVLYDKNPALWDIDLHLPQGKIIGIVGPNGAGKSTLLKALMGMVNTSSGYVKLFGHSLRKVRKRVSYVPQRESVDWDFPISVRQVVMMGRYAHIGLFRRPRQKDKQKVSECLEKVGMTEYAERQIAQLSGGQQQRVFLARALVQEADLYLMDEPFAGIDAKTERLLFQLVKEITSEKKTVVIVFHNLQAVAQHFEWIVLLNKRLIASGRTEEVFTEEKLQETYGGELTLLSEVRHLVRQKNLPDRKK